MKTWLALAFVALSAISHHAIADSFDQANAIINGHVRLAWFTPPTMAGRNVNWRLIGKDESGATYFYTVNAAAYDAHVFVKSAKTMLDGSTGDISISEWRLHCQKNSRPPNEADYFGVAQFSSKNGQWLGQAPIPLGYTEQLTQGTVMGEIAIQSCKLIAKFGGDIAP